MSMRCVVAIALGVVSSAATNAQVVADSIAVESLAARHLIARHQGRGLRLDSAFALPGHAPGSPTARVRPAHRNHALAEFLNARLARGRAGDSAWVVLSEPEFAADSAMVTVTISYDTGRRPRGGFYETVLVILRRAGGQWRVERTASLGIT